MKDRFRQLRQLRRYLGLSATVVYSLRRLRGSSSPVKVHFGGTAVLLRPGGHDFAIASECLLQGHYDLPSGFTEPRGDIAIDAGAYIGVSTLALARRYPARLVVAIEPDADNYRMLVENTRSLTNVLTLNAALSDGPGTADLINRSTGAIGRTIVSAPLDDPLAPSIQRVWCVSIPEILEAVGATSVSILKMDIEGGELAVLSSSDRWMPLVDTAVAELHDRIAPGASASWERATQGRRTTTTQGGELSWAQR